MDELCWKRISILELEIMVVSAEGVTCVKKWVVYFQFIIDYNILLM